MSTLNEAIKSISMSTGLYSKIISTIETEEEFSELLKSELNEETINELNSKLYKRKYVSEFRRPFIDAFIEKLSSYKNK